MPSYSITADVSLTYAISTSTTQQHVPNPNTLAVVAFYWVILEI